jgi:serine-type D-Ala-D-Ala carboxypeptidase/endopeptidase (penicillin-binding protein 4)
LLRNQGCQNETPIGAAGLLESASRPAWSALSAITIIKTPTFAQILRYWTRQKDFDAFRACLPILGTDGSLSSVAVDSPARGKVFAKTGTNVGFDPLGQRLLVQSKALAGFFQRADGEWQVFNVVVNDAGGAPDISAVLSANEDVGEVAAQLWKEANPAGR